jgi:thiol-disulfide isomerase/thioredoxin
MRSKQLLFLLIALSGLTACGSHDRRFRVIGNIAGLPEQTVILEQLSANDQITIVDSEKSKSDGHFELSGVAPEPGLYRLHFHKNKFILLSVDKGNIVVDANWNTLENYTVSGSQPSDDLRSFLISIREHLRDFNTMSIVLDSLQARNNDSLLTVARNDFADLRQHFTQYVEHYADTTAYQPNAIFAARILNPESEKHYLEAFSQSMGRRFPNTQMSRDYAEYYSKVAVRQRKPGKPANSVDSGAVAPEVTYVLLDFWASWCAPCRGENPNVAATYEKFKDKNFAVLGVSLDNQKEAWQKAIKDDGLVWTQVTDFKGWTSPAVTAYNVHAIPANFLIDPNGKIIGRDLRGSQLEEKLEAELNPKPADVAAKPKQ